MWVAVTSPGTELDAADRGMGSLGLTFGGFSEQDKKIAEYRRRIKYCNPVGEVVNEAVNTTNFLFCHEDDEYGTKTGIRVSGTFNYLAEQLLAARQAYPSRSYPNLGLLPALRRESTAPTEGNVPEGLCIGNPDRIITAIKKWEAVGVDRINFLLNAMETVPQEQVLDSLRLFAKEVMPAFKGSSNTAPATERVAATTAAGGN
jgi:hypothetical protein